MKKRLVIAGAGGFGAELLGHVLSSPNFVARHDISDIVFIDERLTRNRCGRSVISKVSNYAAHPGDLVILGTGTPDSRRSIDEHLVSSGAQVVSFVHDSVLVGEESSLGEASVLCPGAQITSNVTLGRGCLVNSSSIVGHNTSLGDFVVINPNSFLGGMTQVSSDVAIGASSSIRPGVKIGRRAFVGLGSSVIRDVPPETRVFGNPAREIPVVLDGGNSL